MQDTGRIHPGGKPANPQPQISSTKNFKFHRQALEVVNSRLYKWASNICHLEDTNVKVEDLSEIDIDAQLEKDVQHLLSGALNCDAETEIEYFRSEQPEDVVREEFTIHGPLGNLRVCRITCNHIDARNVKKNPYSKSPIAKRILQEAKANVAPPPSDAQVKHVACRIVKDNGGELPDEGAAREKGPILLHQAQKELFINRDDATYKLKLDHELQSSEKSAIQTPEILSLVETALLHTKMDNKFHQHLLDTEASNLCERIEGFDVVILRDKNGQLICGVITEAVQKLLPDGTVEKMSAAVEAFTWRFPFKTPDEVRHPTSKTVHLARFPDKDVRSENCKQPHFAVCGVEHYGVHHEMGSSNGLKGLHFQELGPNGEKCPRLYKSSAWKEEFPKVKGVYGIATKVSRLSLMSWDQKLYKDYKEVNEWLPDALKANLATTGDNLYGYMAHLADPLTEGHTDSTDWTGGMAALTCFGEFDGGDLVLPELGVRIPFPSGSNCHLRGRELYHLITGYEGTRHSIVLTNKESVRKTMTKFQDRYNEEEVNAARLQSKDRKDWSDGEAELHEASMKGRSAVLGLVWRSEMERREAAKEKLQQKNADRKAEEEKLKQENAKRKANAAHGEEEEHDSKKPKKTEKPTSQ